MKKTFGYSMLAFIFAVMMTACGVGGGDDGTSAVPNAPTNITITAGDGQITINWNPVSGADSYNIYYNTSAGATTSDTKITGATSPYVHSPLTNGTTYYYAVSAVNAAGESNLSSEVSATPQASAPGAPANVSITAGSREVTISWDPVSGADSYNIYYKISAGVTKSDNKITGATSPYVHSPLSNGTTYYYAVSAVSAGVESSLSAEVSAMPTFATAEIQKILASDAQADDVFGHSVAISGDYAIVGAYSEDGGGADAGAAYIFHRTGTDTWDAGIKITAPDAQAGDLFGFSVAISGDYAVVGAIYGDGGIADEGAAYIFHRTGTNTWGAGTKITASVTSANFGRSVSISGDYAIVGASGEDGGSTDEGAAYIFHRTGTNTWDAGTRIIASDAQADDWFGVSVAISGDYAIVAAMYEDGGSTDEGAAYIFHRTGTNTWDAGTKITASDAQTGDVFGNSVSISGDYAIVGASDEDGGSGDPVLSAGAAYIFHRTGTNTWDAGIKITASDAQLEDYFGVSVSISGDYAIVGAWAEDGGSTNAGAAYIFHRTGTNTWDAGTKITASDAQANDFFGRSVSISGDYAIVGAFWEDEADVNAGAAYIY